jgi:formate/nitrite transporter FocA (FNT family)
MAVETESSHQSQSQSDQKPESHPGETRHERELWNRHKITHPNDHRDPREQIAKEKEWESKEIHDKASASAEMVYKAILTEAEEELERPGVALAFSGLAAGLGMGFSLVAEGLMRARLPAEHWAELVSRLGYTVGFIILILGRQQLFTENTLTPILSLLRRRDFETFSKTSQLWLILLVSNLAGAIAIAYALQRGPMFSDEERRAFATIAAEAMQPDRFTLFCKAIFAGWLIATMIWLLPFAETSRIYVVIIIPYIVGLGGMSHIIVGTVYSIFSVAAGEHTWMEYLTHFFWPVLLGNCVGGVTLVAVINYAQANAGSENEE